MPFAEGGGELAGWASLVGSIVNIGFAAVVGWYLLTKAIPKMQEDFRGEQKATREGSEKTVLDTRAEHREQIKGLATEHKETILAIQAANKESIQAIQTNNKESVKAVLDHCEREAKRRDETFHSEMSLVAKSLTDQGEILEEVRTVMGEVKVHLNNRK